MRLVNKLELSGNLIACRLNPDGLGVSEFYLGEFVESSSFLVGNKGRWRRSVWDLGGVRREWKDGVVESLTVHGDSLHYSLSSGRGSLRGEVKPSQSGAELTEVEGGFAISSEGWTLALVTGGKLKVGGNSYEVSYDDGIEVAVAGGDSKALERARSLLGSGKDLESARREELSRSLQRVWNGHPLWDYCWYVILSNRVSVRHPVLRAPFTVPSKYTFRHQWLWDSSFHAVVLSLYDPDLAAQELENLLTSQRPDGRIPHEIFLSRAKCRDFWGVDDYSPPTTQPPVLAVAVERVLSEKWDDRFAKLALEALVSYDRWLERSRDEDGDSLYSYVHPLESGWDDSVRWDEVKRGEGMEPVEAVDLNSLVYKQRRVISWIARKLGEEELARRFEEKASATGRMVRTLMWDGERGLFYDLLPGHVKSRVKTPAAFMPLFAGLADVEQAEALVSHIFDPKEFWTHFPLPTVSADDPKYDPRGYWRGRSWVNLVWFTYKGLRYYGFREEASVLARRLVDTMGTTCRENYDSSTGEPMGQ